MHAQTIGPAGRRILATLWLAGLLTAPAHATPPAATPAAPNASAMAPRPATPRPAPAVDKLAAADAERTALGAGRIKVVPCF
jgi:hypothetical protein